jgi:5-methyltetrahydropteroyltriglutamate--homocysteine methyltransferase
MSTWPLFPVSVVGSWPRPSWLLHAMKRGRDDVAELMDQATLLAIKYQEDAGVDIVSDGEQRRDNFYSFLCGHLDGFRLMTMADLLDHVEDKAGFEAILQALDVPAYAIKNPTVVGKIVRREPLAVADAKFLRAHTDKPIKVTLPGPYLLSRSTWVKSLSADAYPTRESLVDDIVAVLRAELIELAELGVEMVQFDEPVLSEVVLAGKQATRSFMCAALAASASPEAELELAVDVINRVVEGIEGPLTALHICRGNWSRDEDVLLSGSYEPLIPHLGRMNVDQFVLEYATPRAGPERLLAGLPERVSIGFGAVNPRTEEIEDPDAVAARVAALAELLGPERIFLNPDCGFGTFAERPVASATIASGKLACLATAARKLRSRAR